VFIVFLRRLLVVHVFHVGTRFWLVVDNSRWVVALAGLDAGDDEQGEVRGCFKEANNEARHGEVVREGCWAVIVAVVRVIVPAVAVQEVDNRDSAEGKPKEEINSNTGAGVDAPAAASDEDGNALGDVPDARDDSRRNEEDESRGHPELGRGTDEDEVKDG
jgi:hypothetical protein